MKHYMLPKSTSVHRETSPQSNDAMASPNSSSSKRSKKQNRCKENLDPNLSPATVAKAKCPLPPRPPSSNPLKRKLSTDTVPENSTAGALDSGVKVIVRIRPRNQDERDEETIVEKVSSDSVLINGQTFTFDAVANTDSTQVDIFELVGAPLVENCLAGFNSSIFAYGQTGSGKTYTMWGPTHALSEEKLSDQQGLTPRILRHLFARINEEQIKHVEKQLKYQCRCSFLEIYNEQITDLLDPNQGILQIREDVKSGVYVENLIEETVCSMKDVNQLLLKGLSNRRTGATSINAESSRSHSVFTCIIESRCKSTADGISSFKTSRINLVDLAGSERQKLTGAGGERLKEAGNINRSLSQLGNLINILAEVSQTGKQRHIPYRDSKLTFLLQESLGGNAKLAMVCAVSPAQRCKSETSSTLRFAQRAKAIKNKAVVNEVMQEDVKFLREVIRQLKDELLRMKANGNSPGDPNCRQLTGQDVRRSLSILKLSLHHRMTSPNVDDDGDEEMEIDEQAIERLCDQVSLRCSSAEGRTVNKNELAIATPDCQHPSENQSKAYGDGFSEDQGSEDTDVTMEEGISEQVNETDSVEPTAISPVKISDQQIEKESEQSDVTENDVDTLRKEDGDPKKISAELSPPGISVSSCNTSPKLKSPTPSVSPRITNTSRKSLRTSLMLTASQKDLEGYSNSESEVLHVSSSRLVKEGSANLLSTENRNSSHVATELLAASLHRGLEKLDNHRRSLALRGSAFRFSFKPSDSKFILPIVKVDVGVQANPQENDLFLCSNCKNSMHTETQANEASNLQLVPVDGSEFADKLKKQVPKAVEKVLAGSFRREMALEEYCAKQTSEILQLNRLVQQYKHERECNAIIAQTREDKILRLESLMDGVLPTAEFLEEEFASLDHEYKLLKDMYENHPEVLQAKIEVKRLQDELEQYQNFFDMGEREVLLEEIQDLRSQLQYYIDASAGSTRNRSPLLQLKNSCEPNSDPVLTSIPESKEESSEEKFEQEKLRWMEAESNWISLAEELRTELDTSRSLAQKLQQELDTEKKCAEDLKEAMQLAMQSNARMLEQYADLEEKHIQLLARHRNIQDGIDDVKKAAAKAGVRGAESKFINALAAEISALKMEREKERRRMRDENRELQAQLRDTAEAVQAAGELLVRLKESEEAVTAAHKRAVEAEQESQKAYKEIDQLKMEHKKEIRTLKQILADSRLPKEAIRPYDDLNVCKYNSPEPQEAGDQHWREEFKELCDGELGEPTSWFSGYDRCNI